MPNPDDDHFYGICCNNIDMGPMGPGFPLYFEFRKYVSYLLAILTVILFIPAEYMIYQCYKEYTGKLRSDDSAIGLWSFGAFIQYVGVEDFDLDTETR